MTGEAGVTPRTIRFYTAEGLLPPPDARGKYALYTEEHLSRLDLIGKLKDAYLPLGEIRARIEHLNQAGVAEMLATVENESSPTPPGQVHESASASAYIARVLATQSIGAQQPPPRPSAPAIHAMATPAPPMQAAEPLPAPDTWERLELAPGVELHARAASDHETHNFIRRIVEYAKTLRKGR